MEIWDSFTRNMFDIEAVIIETRKKLSPLFILENLFIVRLRYNERINELFLD